MKNTVMRIFWAIVLLCLSAVMVLPVTALNESNNKGVKFVAWLDKEMLEQTGSVQTVEMTFSAAGPITLDGIGFRVICDDELKIKSIAGNGSTISFAGADYNVNSGMVGWSTPNAENISGVSTIAKVIFTVPADIAPGRYMVGVENIEVTSDYGSVWERSASASVALTIKGDADDTTSTPEDTKVPDDTTSTPEDTQEPDDTTSTPEDTQEPEDTTSTPEDTTAEPEDTTAEPEDTTEPEDPVDPEDIVLPFTDVREADWFYDSVKYMYTNKLMQGTAADEFVPNGVASRAMLVTMLWRLEGSPVLDRTNAFTDVPASAWYASAVEWAYRNEIVLGYPDGTFAPDNAITREQMVSVLWRYAKNKGVDVSVDDSVSLGQFADADEVSDYAALSMRWAFERKLIQGVGDTTLAPKQTASRAQIAAVFMRFTEYMK